MRSLLSPRESRSVMPMTRMIEDLLQDPFQFALAPVALSRDEGAFALDFSENDREFIVRASLSGFSSEEVDVEVNEGVLTIKAEHKEEHEQNDERYFRRERRMGSVLRQIVLPGPVQDEQANAELRDGVLTLRLPKVQKEPARKIAVGGDGMRRPSQVGQGDEGKMSPQGQQRQMGNRRHPQETQESRR